MAEAASPAKPPHLTWLLLTLWAVLVLWQMSGHVFWRDEVRALSIALQGEGFVGMFAALHGEGHPGVWYVLLRSAHTLVARPEVLPAVSFAVASAAVWLLVRRAPFPLALIGLVLATRFVAHEYVVTARNYGVSMLAMFAFASLYAKHSRRGYALGAILFLLCNTNVHSVPLAGALLLFWLLDVLGDTGLRWTPQLRTVLLNAAIAAVGVVACALTVYPTFNDSAAPDLSDVRTALRALASIGAPGIGFNEAFLDLSTRLSPEGGPVRIAVYLASSGVLLGAVLGLVKHPPALAAAIVGLIASAPLLSMVGSAYRHQALWVGFLVCLYWITWDRRPAPAGPRIELARRAGLGCFAALLGFQVLSGAEVIARALRGDPPPGRSHEFAAFLRTRPELRDAIIIADPDYLIEPLPYYISNQTYLLRERRFGNIVKFTNSARLELGLDDMLEEGCRLNTQTGRPVLALLYEHLTVPKQERRVREGYAWTFVITPESAARFRASTERLVRFGPASAGETFDVYRLNCATAGRDPR